MRGYRFLRLTVAPAFFPALENPSRSSLPSPSRSSICSSSEPWALVFGDLFSEIIARFVCHRVENAIENIVSSEVDNIPSLSAVSNCRRAGIYGSLRWTKSSC